MTRIALSLVLVALIGACSSPMARVDKLSEVDLPEDAPSRDVMPAADPEAGARATRGLFATIFGGGGGGATTQEASIDPQSVRGTAGEVVAPGETLPYGELVRACNLSPRDLGQETERYRDYRIYDTAPGGSGMRTFYVTGFDDGCPRQFSAALAMFGSAEMHEQLRYGLPKEVQPYSRTDQAYEEIKGRVCRAAAGEPCGSRLDRLDRDTVFISIYERFGSNPEWANILLHDGEVAAMDLKRG